MSRWGLRDAYASLAAWVRQQLQRPFSGAGFNLTFRCKIGAALYPDDVAQAQEILQRAEIALRQPRRGGNVEALVMFQREMFSQARYRLETLASLRHALDHGRFCLYAQGQVDARGHYQGLEGLLRWPAEDGHWISPAEFIPLAEQSGLIVPLGDWVVEQAAAFLRRLRIRRGVNPLGVFSVNISTRQLQRTDFVANLVRILEHYEVPLTEFGIEITEGVVVEDFADVAAKLQTLKRLGLQIAIDDFGTGYSSLSYLQRLPLDVVKIDRCFIRGLSRDNAGMVPGILQLAGDLGLATVAEGVETAAEVLSLQELGCDYIQGFYFSVPQSLAAWEEEVAL